MVKFQIIDIDFDDVNVNLRPDELKSEECMSTELFENLDNPYPPREFLVTIYGITEDGKKIVCNAYNFHPYFYVNFNQKDKCKKKIEQIISRYIYKVVTPVKKDKYDSNNNPIIDKSGKKDYRPVLYQTHKDSRIDKECQIVSRKDFYYYSKSKKDFYKMSFNTFQSYKAFAKAIRIFSKNNKSIKKTKTKYKDSDKDLFKTRGKQVFKLYESNIHPLIRFLHFYDIKPSSWISISDSDLIETAADKRRFNCDVEYSVNILPDIDNSYKKRKKTDDAFKPVIIKPADSDVIANIKIASFDIECDSSHGDFPLAQKTFKKLAVDVFDQFHLRYKKCPKIVLFQYKGENNPILDRETKCLYITILTLIGILDDPKYIIKSIIKAIPNIYKSQTLQNKTIQINNMLKNMKLTKGVSIEEIRTDNNINKVFLKHETTTARNPYKDIMIDRHISSIWNNYTKRVIAEEIDSNCLIDHFTQSKSNKERDININILDFILSNYNTNKLTYDIINHIVSDDQLNIILAKHPLSSIGDVITDQAAAVAEKDDYAINTTILHAHYKPIDKKTFIVNTMFQKGRGIKYKCLNPNGKKDKPLINDISVEGDKIIQIGIVFHEIAIKDKFTKYIIVIPYDPKDFDPDDKEKRNVCTIEDDTENDIIIVSCCNECELLLKFTEIMKEENPEIVTGYNVVGFDFDFMNKRADEVWLKSDASDQHYGNKYKFYDLGRLSKDRIRKSLIESGDITPIPDDEDKVSLHKLKESDPITDTRETYISVNEEYSKEWNKKCRPVCKTLSSSGLGDNDLVYIHMNGRVIFDVQKEIQKNFKLDSYKLDNVSANFIRGIIDPDFEEKSYSHEIGKYEYTFKTSYTGRLQSGKFMTIAGDSNIGEQKYGNNTKFKILKVATDKTITIESLKKIDKTIIKGYKKAYWCESKDDLPPQKIFDYHKLDGKHRGEVAKYCIQDCELVILIILKLDFITNNQGMSNVCRVPLSYIFLRGQGVKAHSVVSFKCLEMNYLIPDINKYRDEEEDYEELKNDSKVSGDDDDLLSEGGGGWYEGAIVLEPKCGIYLEDPVSVVDFTSLYPTSIIEKNMSPETFLGSMKYKKKGPNTDRKLINKPLIKYFDTYKQDPCDYSYNIDDEVKLEPEPEPEPEPELEPEPEPVNDNYTYVKVDYKNYKSKDVLCDKLPEIECRFICKNSKKLNYKTRLGIIPSVLNDLLQERKKTKALLKKEPDPFKKKILDGRQLALKLTANSIYGQLGARTSPIYFKEIAACTTAVGRFRINDAVEGLTKWATKYIEREDDVWNEFINDGDEDLKYDDVEKYPGTPLKTLNFDDSNVIYGDTDSVFVKFDTTKFDEHGKPTDNKHEGEDAVKRCIKLGRDAQKWMDKNNLKGTGQCLEYEKTFYPLILISKKRYVGNKYEMDPKKCYRDSNGIVLKRRDNAPIVKHVFGNVIEKIITDHSIAAAHKFLKDTLKTLDDPTLFPVDYFVVSKTLRGYYKCPPAHKLLANRMAERDPGTAPKSNDRLPYVYIKLNQDRLWKEKILKTKDKDGNIQIRYYKNNNIKQGDKIEHIDYYNQHAADKDPLKLDYTFYITNQIMNSVVQVLDLDCCSDSGITSEYKGAASKIFDEVIEYYKDTYDGHKPV